MGSDQPVQGRVGDRPVAIDEADADDAGNEGACPDEAVELRPAAVRDRSGEVARPQLPAQRVLGDHSRPGLDRPLGPVGDLPVDDPDDRQAGGREHGARVEREPQQEARRRLTGVCAYLRHRW